MTTAVNIGAAWATKAPALAEWAMERMVNRTDSYGLYLPTGGGITAKDGLTAARLVGHFRGETTLGLHLIGSDNFCRFAAWDFDQHDEADPQAATARNLNAGLALIGKLEQMGMYPLLEDSDGKGGVHVWVLFDRPRLARDVYRWARGLAPAGCEAFPKQMGVAPEPGKGHYGNYIRLPGRHHKRPHWSRFYIAGDWFEGDDAVSILLEWTPSDTDVIPAEPDDPAANGQPSPALTGGPADAIEALRHLKRLSPGRADDYDDWLRVGMILHDVEPSQIMLAAWDAWSRQSTRFEAGKCAEKWLTFDGPACAANNKGKRLTIATLVAMANQDSGREARAAPRQPAPADAPDPLERVGPQGIVFTAVDVARTPKRINVRFAVSIGGTPTEMDVTGSDTAGGQRSAWSELAEVLGFEGKTLTPEAEQEVRAWLKKLLTRASLDGMCRHLEQARSRASAQARVEDPRSAMLEVATEFMRKHLDLRFILPEEMAVWSERLGVLLRQGEFTSRIEPGLLEAVRVARDYAAPTPNDPTKPIKHLQQVLKPVWCAITAALPREANAGLGPDSKAAALFKRSIVALWLAPETWMKFDATSDLPTHVERMSLASRARGMVSQAIQRPEQWQRVLKGVNAFFRVGRAPGGDPVVWLGMRADLCHGEIKGHVLPGVETQHDLALLANRYGVADTAGVPVHITDGHDRRRLLVLSRALCDYLIDCVDEAEPLLRVAAEPGATELVNGERIDLKTGEVLDAT